MDEPVSSGPGAYVLLIELGAPLALEVASLARSGSCPRGATPTAAVPTVPVA